MAAPPQQPLIPSRLTHLQRANLVMDGDLKDWPAQNQAARLGAGFNARGTANAAVYLAWSAQGLHVGARCARFQRLSARPA